MATNRTYSRVLYKCRFCGARSQADVYVIRVEMRGSHPVIWNFKGTAARAGCSKYEGKAPQFSSSCPCGKAKGTSHQGKEAKGRLVKGTLDESHPCDPRCTGAVGSECVCACGGANHGADNDPLARFAALVEARQAELARIRAARQGA
jgi:hypothetical protein